MDRIEFSIKGLVATQSNRFRRTGGSPASPIPKSAPKTVALGVGALVVAYTLAAPPELELTGGPPRGRSVLLLLDKSGSMGAFTARIEGELERLRSRGSIGLKVKINGSASQILENIKSGLLRSPSSDTIWLVSDFHDDTDLVQGTNRDRWEELLSILRRRGIKLYLTTVSKRPTEDQIEIACASGGAWGSYEADELHPCT